LPYVRKDPPGGEEEHGPHDHDNSEEERARTPVKVEVVHAAESVGSMRRDKMERGIREDKTIKKKRKR
jgi:hypothetical protein